MNRKSQKQKLITALSSGADFTVNQLTSRVNASPSRVRFLITELRQSGYAVYRNQKTFAYGDRASVYRLGTPSKTMVAAAFRLCGGSVFA